MDPEKFLAFGTEYISDYLTSFLITVSKPRLLFQPVTIESQIPIVSSQKPKFSLSPRLFSFAIISIIIGLSLQNSTSSSISKSDLTFQTSLVILIAWFFLASMIGITYQVILVKASFFELFSINLQIIASQYVVSCSIAFLWSYVYRIPFLNDYLKTANPVIELIGEEPSYLYFVCQLLLLNIFVPWAIINTYGKNKTVSGLTRRVISAILLLAWVSICAILSFEYWSATGFKLLLLFP